MHFGDLRLLVSNFARSFRFYRDVLELTVDWADEAFGYAQFKSGSLTLALYSREAMARLLGTAALPHHAEAQDWFALCFVVPDVDEAYHQLTTRGAAGVTEPRDQAEWGYRIAHLRDPDGNLIELYAPLRQG